MSGSSGPYTGTSSFSTVSEVDDNKEYANASLMQLQGVIGFNGAVPSGLLLHPGDKHLIYPLGSTIVVRELKDNTQTFLQKNGHNKAVSCLALSPSGKYLASGQVTHMGFPALVIVWNLETYEVIHRLVLHKGKIQDLAFSPNEQYLATLGGRDDNKLVIWDIATGEPICGSTAANDMALTVRFFNNRDDMLVTGGAYNLRVWQFDLPNRKIRPTDCQLGQLKRVITSVTIDDEDEFMYCGTKTGDVLQVSLTRALFKISGPAKKPFPLGVTCVARTKKGNIIVGSGDGTVALLKKDDLSVIKTRKLLGGITSLCLNAAGDHFFVGTDKCHIYLVELATFDHELRNTCHSERINDVAFARDYSELFATCSVNDIRVWHARTGNELLRIQVPNLECLCVAFSADGKSIVSGWDDGKIRAFGPQSGKLQWAINDAHQGGVSSLVVTRDCQRVISGGINGQIRVWAIGRQTQKMLASMKEHKGRVHFLHLNNTDQECVSASADGSCIVWNLNKFTRNNALFASTQFKAILYHPDQSQLLSAGTDRKITYWDVVDANPIRIIDGSASEPINTLAISADGNLFVSGGGDKLVKVWGYDEGTCYCLGIGHSGAITQAKISPDQRTIVTVGDEGAVFMWTMPQVDFEPATGNSSSKSSGYGLSSGISRMGLDDGYGYDSKEESKYAQPQRGNGNGHPAYSSTQRSTQSITSPNGGAGRRTPGAAAGAAIMQTASRSGRRPF